PVNWHLQVTAPPRTRFEGFPYVLQRFHTNVARPARVPNNICRCPLGLGILKRGLPMQGMQRRLIFMSVLAGTLGLIVPGARVSAQGPKADFGLFIADQLRAHSEQLFGLRHPLSQSVPGPYDGTDNTQAIEVADGLTVSLVSSSVASAADQIALWPNDEHPT